MEKVYFTFVTKLVVVLSAFMVGCQGQLANRSYRSQSELTIEALDACEAVFWKLLDQMAPKFEPCYLVLLGEDPSDEFLKRFGNKYEHVKKVSQIQYYPDGDPYRVVGVKLDISKVSRLDEHTFHITAGYYIRPEGAGGATYIVQRFAYGGKWVIVGQKGLTWRT